MDTILAILFFIVWVPLTIIIFSAIVGNTTVISFDGCTGLFSEYLGILILSGFIAAVIIVAPFWFLGGLIDFVVNHWILFGILGFGAWYLLSKGKKHTEKEVDGSSHNPNDEKES